MLNFDIKTLAQFRHCYFVVRADHRAKPGGDVDLARQISSAAAMAGATVSVVGLDALPSRLNADDLLFLFNIDRPFDAAMALERAHPNGRALLYTLHHPSDGVAKYLTKVHGLKGLIGRAAGNCPDRYEALIDAVKGTWTRDPNRLKVAMTRHRVIKRLLERCQLLVTSEAELDEIRARFGEPPQLTWLLPHPIAPYAPPMKGERAAGLRYILVPGRIEPRKNQFAALQALTAMRIKDRGLEIVLAGGKGGDQAYFNRTIDFASSSGIVYVSQLPKSLFFPAVSSATLVINASFFEVTSLIDLYAIQYGVPIVTTMYGYYAAAPNLRQVDPLGWSSSPTSQVCAAVEDMLLRAS